MNYRELIESSAVVIIAFSGLIKIDTSVTYTNKGSYKIIINCVDTPSYCIKVIDTLLECGCAVVISTPNEYFKILENGITDKIQCNVIMNEKNHNEIILKNISDKNVELFNLMEII